MPVRKSSKTKAKKSERARGQALDLAALAAARVDLERSLVYRMPRDPLELAMTPRGERPRKK